MKKIVNILLSFAMCFTIFLLGISITASTIISAPFLKGVIKLSNYVKNVEPEIAESLQSLTIPSGLPEDFFDDKIHTEYIEKTLNECIEAAVNRKTYDMPTPEIEELIFNDLKTYANEKGIEIDEKTEESLRHTASVCSKYYINYTFAIFYRVIKHLGGVSLKMLIVSIVLLVVLVFMHYLLNGKKELAYALLGAGAMLVTPIYFIITGKAFEWAISSEALLKVIYVFMSLAIAIPVVLGIASILFGIKKAKKYFKES